MSGLAGHHEDRKAFVMFANVAQVKTVRHQKPRFLNVVKFDLGRRRAASHLITAARCTYLLISWSSSWLRSGVGEWAAMKESSDRPGLRCWIRPAVLVWYLVAARSKHFAKSTW